MTSSTPDSRCRPSSAGTTPTAPSPWTASPSWAPTATQGLYVATGTYRDGFHSSPVIARHLADVILDPAARPELLSLFAPARAPVETMTVEESVDLFVSDAVETATEYGMRLPYFLDTDPLADRARMEAHQALQRLDRPIALQPEILAAVREAPPAHIQHLNTYLRSASPGLS